MRRNGWGVEWHSRNRLDGVSRYLLWKCPGQPLFFETRQECRAYIQETYSHIRHRPDLRAEPHGYRMPQAVRVVVEVRKVSDE